MNPYSVAVRLWLDAIIDPLETRTWISVGIEASFAKTLRQLKAAQQAPATREFNMGVLQT
jgi:acetyl-CoA carboxylase carboxyltransferase component